MTDTCPLCTIPTRETSIYIDNQLYLVKTKTMKGHSTRVMIAIREHRLKPTFEELTKAYSILINYMTRVMKGGSSWFIVDSTYATIKGHFHIIACDSKGTPEELELLNKTPKVEISNFSNLSTKNAKVLIGIPAFNEEKTIGTIVHKAKKYGIVMVVDDGSTDNTVERALTFGAGVTQNDKNYGYGYSLRKIFREAQRENFDILITLDADGQHDPDEIPKFIQAIENGADVVTGNRFMGDSKLPSYRKLGINVVSKLEGVGDAQCGFRAFNRRAIEVINIKRNGMGASLDILHEGKKKGLKLVEIPCSIQYKQTKHSKNPLSHGSVLIESILWKIILNLYLQFHTFVMSWALLSLGGVLGGALLLVTATLVYLFKRGLEETR